MGSMLILTQQAKGIFSPIAKLLGLLLNAIYNFLDKSMGIQNISIAIIIFTLLVYMCMLPMTYQQQKFSKMSRIMNPELQAVQKKYKNRKDQNSMAAMQAETQAVYRKYGVKPSGSCIFMAIQLIILMPLYRVIYNVPAYVTSVKDTFTDVVNGIMATSGYEDTMQSFLDTVSSHNSVFRSISFVSGGGDDTANSIIDILYKCTSDNWNTLATTFPDLSTTITNTQGIVSKMNNFLGASIVYSPKGLITTSFSEHAYGLIFIGILIPVISAASQFLNIRLMPQPDANPENQMAGQMKMMNYMMPLYSLFIVLFLPIGVGIYWIAGAVIRCIQQFVINKILDKKDINKIIEKNQKKNANRNPAKVAKEQEAIKKAAKQVNSQNTKAIKSKNTMAAKADVSGVANVNTNRKYKSGSMAAQANLVRDSYNKKKDPAKKPNDSSNSDDKK